ncbi:unnamed protein product [Penicillium egyptiacum]|uniref:chitinase n=1 Tax=Penicillium egyptiacum TaxID=1303716 RepID=A0A9W4KPJ7_9EURO|nr:unnamed protein product [Penicillium egyptiacum]
MSEMKSVAYFVNWAIYGRNYNPQDLPAQKLTHILYAFANVRPENGEVYLTDSWSDVEKHYPTDSWNDVGDNVYGCAKQLFLLKKQNRKMKVLLSIGGWTYSANFAQPASSEEGRATFAESATRLVLDLGFDGMFHRLGTLYNADLGSFIGLDIDWEYPKGEIVRTYSKEVRGSCYVQMTPRPRTWFSCSRSAEREAGPDRRFYLTIACPAGPSNYEKLKFQEMTPLLDFYNLMAYDFAGSWDTNAGHQANIAPSNSNPASTPFSINAALDHYINVGGVPPSKIVMGMPLYGRAFEDTDGPGTPFSGVGEGSWENGVWDYKALPRPGAEEQFDEESSASYCYDGGARTMVSYDTAHMAQVKANYIRERGLGGGMWWESSGDKGGKEADPAEGSLIGIFVDGVGGEGALDQSANALEYPESKYDNVKAGFPEE